MKEGMTDIHEIRPPVMVGMDPDTAALLLWIAGALVLILGTVFLIRYFWRRRKPAQKIDILAEIPPYDAAVSALDRLALDPGHDAKTFYFDLNHALKAYLGGTYHVNCLEMTTQELIRTLRGLDIREPLKTRISKFQDICDPFRYAPLSEGLALNPKRLQSDLETARGLISDMEKEVTARAKAALTEGES